MKPYPIILDPVFKPKIWGGRRLADALGKPLPPNEPIGESWELADLPNGDSTIRNGPAAGQALHALVEAWGADLLGGCRPVEGRFPLLVKFLDANDDLSVQVHPTAAMAATEPDAHLKNEAWYVLAAEPDAAIYFGLTPGVTRSQFVAALDDGDVARLLRRVSARPGDCYYLPSGTVHALGAGVLVAEVQTPSDTTYRLFDWNRVDASTGKPRTLHIEPALRCIDFDRPAPSFAEPRQTTQRGPMRITRLVTCEQFAMDEVVASAPVVLDPPTEAPRVRIVLAGEMRLRGPALSAESIARRGDVVLVPAAAHDAVVEAAADSTWLDVTLPVGVETGGATQPR